MTRSNIHTVLERMNSLQRLSDKYSDRSYDLYQESKVSLSDKYDKKAEKIDDQIKGMEITLHMLGLGAWKTHKGEWVIPDDDIIHAT